MSTTDFILDLNSLKDRLAHEESPEASIGRASILEVAIVPALLERDDCDTNLFLVLANVLLHCLLCVGLRPEVVPPLVVFLDQSVQTLDLHAGTPVELVESTDGVEILHPVEFIVGVEGVQGIAPHLDLKIVEDEAFSDFLGPVLVPILDKPGTVEFSQRMLNHRLHLILRHLFSNHREVRHADHGSPELAERLASGEVVLTVPLFDHLGDGGVDFFSTLLVVCSHLLRGVFLVPEGTPPEGELVCDLIELLVLVAGFHVIL